MNKQLSKLTRMAMLTALAVVLAGLIHFPLFPAASFLEYDPADAIVLMTAFLYGPWEGVLVTVVVSVLQGITVSAGSSIIGIIMHIIATSSLCLVSGYLYRAKPETGRLIFALVAGALTMTVVMAGCNLLLTPLYTGLSVGEIAAMLPTIFLPFNALKAGLNATAAFFLYQSLKKTVLMLA